MLFGVVNSVSVHKEQTGKRLKSVVRKNLRTKRKKKKKKKKEKKRVEKRVFGGKFIIDFISFFFEPTKNKIKKRKNTFICWRRVTESIENSI